MHALRSQRLQLAGVLCVLSLTSSRNAATSPDRRVALVAETIENTVDASAQRGCLIRENRDVARKQAAWISLGAVKPDAEKVWKAAASRVDCGDGSFDKTGTETVR